MYVARDKDGTLCVFFNKPVKGYIFERWQVELVKKEK